MVSRRLRFLGSSLSDASDSGSPDSGSPDSGSPESGSPDSGSPESGGRLLLEGAALEVDTTIDLVRRRSPWNPHRPQERVILGTDPARGDVLLDGTALHPEHLRFYLPRDGEGPDDMKVIEDGTVWVNGRSVLHSEWYALQNGDEIACGPWLFRFEREG